MHSRMRFLLLSAVMVQLSVPVNVADAQTTLKATGIPATALPATALPATALPATALPATVLPAATLPGTEPQVRAPVASRFDHSVFDELLHVYVKDGRVDYPSFRGNAKFAGYLSSLRTANLSGLEEPERIAFWLNTYNAYTIQLVASRGELQSIRNINKTWGVLRLKGPWTEPLVQAAGQTLTLDDVEHRILRHEFAEPRVHFAMTLAALGGPRLRSEAYTGEQLDQQLESQGWEFLHDTLQNRVDTLAQVLYVSPVLSRYSADFGDSPVALARFVAEYYPPGAERRFLSPPQRLSADVVGNPQRDRSGAGTVPRDSTAAAQGRRRGEFRYLRVVQTPFDWTLNIQKPK